MNSKQRKTLERVFATPAPHLKIEWQEIERLLIACGAQVLEADGSAIRIILGERCAFLHRPHPQKEAKAYQVKAVRELLESAGVRP
ncbi:type II toxin-antitoxin system HicA family toxin [Acidithiobacillus sp. CV18-2]|nr:type II toxin-antitoxin system HicA family toxin [Acidithiobacillus sp. CV18-3]MBU2756298.1 type II toxin-antitoxin system HicA family toxin [Acidithiobacillus sp. BN09-2]MBU2763724.1 type II toxin-antitoxin system HicA family toxin [Acidithiobacillus caldus]MBU2776262.1 type II toxin-antitoxin system HicA family toxin [Acidithiobacillus sp. CV18-2]MBU2800026.1 type II toxin-antitoxin system HicA family toxin [Acidithiobacillus sp. VAN18-4]